eukprot:6183138-Pleurochrysis_carterae.AAC.3
MRGVVRAADLHRPMAEYKVGEHNQQVHAHVDRGAPMQVRYVGRQGVDASARAARSGVNARRPSMYADSQGD